MQELRGEFHVKAVTALDICHREGPGSILSLLWKSYQCVNIVQLLLHWIVPIFSLKERKHKEEATFWAGQLCLSESKIFPVVAACACDPMETVLHRRTHNRQPDNHNGPREYRCLINPSACDPELLEGYCSTWRLSVLLPDALKPFTSLNINSVLMHDREIKEEKVLTWLGDYPRDNCIVILLSVWQ